MYSRRSICRRNSRFQRFPGKESTGLDGGQGISPRTSRTGISHSGAVNLSILGAFVNSYAGLWLPKDKSGVKLSEFSNKSGITTD